MKQKEFNDFLPYGEPKLEATEGRRSKASKLQWFLLIYGLCYFIFIRYFVDQITDSTARNILCAVLSVIAVILLIATGIQNIKRRDRAFSYGTWLPPMAIIFIAMLEYYSGDLF